MAYDLLLPTPILDLLMFIYPSYCSVAALKDNDRDKIIQYMTYWMVFAAFATVEGLLFFLLRFVPLYTVARRAFCIWCILPTKHNGGTFIYYNVIDGLFSNVTEELSQLSFEQIKRVAEQIAVRLMSQRRRAAPGAGADADADAALEQASAHLAVAALGPVVSGLEQMRDKAEAYRDQVMDQLLCLAAPDKALAGPSSPRSLDARGVRHLERHGAVVYHALMRARARANARAMARARARGEGDDSGEDSLTDGDSQLSWTGADVYSG